jgi:hypothetical protein
MMRFRGNIDTYVLFVVFCLLSAVRDVISESYLKHETERSSVFYVLFIYSIVAQVFAAALILLRRGRSISVGIKSVIWRRENILINIFTITAFLFYFLAISSPLGAALNAFVDYGLGPAAATAAIAGLLVRERLSTAFFLSLVSSLFGIILFLIPRWEAQGVSILWFVGMTLAILNTLSGAVYHGYFKVLLNQNADRAEIMLLRLMG